MKVLHVPNPLCWHLRTGHHSTLYYMHRVRQKVGIVFVVMPFPPLFPASEPIRKAPNNLGENREASSKCQRATSSRSPTSCCCYAATSQQLAHPPPAPLPRDASAASSNGCRLSIKRRPSLQGRRREQTTALGFRRRFGALLILSSPVYLFSKKVNAPLPANLLILGAETKSQFQLARA